MDRVLSFIEDCSLSEAKELIESIKPISKKVGIYCQKNNLFIGIFSQDAFISDYLSEYKLAPKEWFGSAQILVIDALEKKLGFEFIDKTLRDSHKAFSDLKDKTKNNYQASMTFTYVDGSTETF